MQEPDPDSYRFRVAEVTWMGPPEVSPATSGKASRVRWTLPEEARPDFSTESVAKEASGWPDPT